MAGGWSNISRRRFTAGGLIAMGAASVSAALSGCGRSGGDADAETGSPQMITDKSKITTILSDYEESKTSLDPIATWELPLGTVLFHTGGTWAAAMLSPATALAANQLGALSLSTGKIALLAAAATQGAGFGFFDVRCSDEICAWVEMNFATRRWVLLAQSFSAGELSGDPVKIDHGDENYDPPHLTVTGSSVIWFHMPAATGKRSKESSWCLRWSSGDSKPEKLVESAGRFASAPHVADDILTVTPRVLADKGTYYGLTALDLTAARTPARDQLVLPAAVRPFEAVYLNGLFAFSIEAAYAGGGLLGAMGTYLGRAGGRYLFLNREPLACPAGNKKRYLIKSQSSHFLVDTAAKTFATLRSPDRSLDFGDYPASEGRTDRFLTYATTRNEQGLPGAVTARLFSI